MRLKHLLAGMLVLGTAAVAARSQPAVDTTRVPQWYDPVTGTTHLVSSQYPLPLRPPSMVHSTLTNVVLATGVAQVVIPAGSITSGCDITFANEFGDFYIAYTDPSAPTVPTAAAPAVSTSGAVITPGRGLHVSLEGGSYATPDFIYHCPGPTAQGLSILYVGTQSSTATPPTYYSPNSVANVDVY